MAHSADQRVRRRVLYSGQVQGVGFRFTACQSADRHDVTGFVRNLPGPRRQVEVMAEGVPSELDAFLADLAERMAGYISSAETQTGPATGEFPRFEVRF